MIFKNIKTFLPSDNQNERLKGQILKKFNKTTSFKEITIVFDKKESPKYCYTTYGRYKANHCYIQFKFKRDDLFCPKFYLYRLY